MKPLILSLTLLAVTLTGVSSAHAVGRMADVDVIERHSGRTLPLHYYRGEYWVAGTPGAAYAIRVRNQTGERLLAVMSVDGVNVLSGETAAVGQSGYVFDAWRQSDIAGWRKSNAQIAAFEFTASPQSYAERTGRPGEVGVIGVALFRERPVVVPQPLPQVLPMPQPEHHGHQDRSLNHGPSAEKAGAAPRAGTAPAASAAAQEAARDMMSGGPQARSPVEPKLGTGHGARESSVVTHTSFERLHPAPSEVVRIRYDSHHNLVAMGVIREWRRPAPHQPNPFPESPVGYGYVPDPAHWR